MVFTVEESSERGKPAGALSLNERTPGSQTEKNRFHQMPRFYNFLLGLPVALTGSGGGRSRGSGPGAVGRDEGQGHDEIQEDDDFRVVKIIFKHSGYQKSDHGGGGSQDHPPLGRVGSALPASPDQLNKVNHPYGKPGA